MVGIHVLLVAGLDRLEPLLDDDFGFIVRVDETSSPVRPVDIEALQGLGILE